MGKFRDVVFKWFDQDWLMSRRPDPGPGEEGNPLLETGIAYCFLAWLKESSEEDAKIFFHTIENLEVEPGLYNPKARSTDLITHDDIIGVCAGSVAIRSCIHFLICNYGMSHGWNFSNNGSISYTAQAKPWHRSFYLWCSNIDPGFWDNCILAGSIIVNALCQMDDASGKRLYYLIVKTIRGKSLICDLAILLWWFRIKRVYGSARRIFVMYHGEKHPFSLYCPD